MKITSEEDEKKYIEYRIQKTKEKLQQSTQRYLDTFDRSILLQLVNERQELKVLKERLEFAKKNWEFTFEMSELYEFVMFGRLEDIKNNNENNVE